MSTSSEPAHLDPSNPIYYAPRALRERAKSRNIRSELLEDNVFSPSSSQSSRMEAIEKSSPRPLDPEFVNDPPRYDKGLGQWMVAWWSALAVGGLTILALALVIVISFSRDHVRNSNASNILGLPTSPLKAAAPEGQSKPRRGDSETILTTNQANRPTHPATTHEQSEALLHRFLQWQQNLESTNHPSR